MSQFDAVVVGSGISGGWAAKELCERGLEVMLLERGRNVVHGSDYVTEHKPPWEFKFREQGDPQLYAKEYPVQRQCWAFDDTTSHFFVNDKEHPYETSSEKPFVWIRGYHLGGRSLTWGRVSLRLSDLDFEANKKDGHGVDWPIRYRDLAPWYDHVERFIGVSGETLSLPHLPDGIFQPPMQLSCAEQHLKASIERQFPGRHLNMARVANLTRPLGDRAACHYCGPCQRGCSAGAYFSSLSSTLPAAKATHNLTIRTDCIVEGVVHDPRRGRAAGVRVIDAHSRKRETITARVVFLCASTLGSTQILMNSRSESFPRGLGNSSGVLGSYLMDHAMVNAGFGVLPGFEDKYYRGFRPQSHYIPRFRNLPGDTDAHDFVRGYGYQGNGARLGWQRGAIHPGFGRDLKAALRKPGPWTISLGGMGECLPYADNKVWLDEKRVDRWGIPLLHTQFSWHENELNMATDMATQAGEMLKAAGFIKIRTGSVIAPGGLAVHEMGTARMGHDPTMSVLNGHNQCHDVPNVFVTDGAAMASTACQNPSLTYMALTARAANYAADLMQAGQL
jgi:choline dehydrogenase-like flavoprotein